MAFCLVNLKDMPWGKPSAAWTARWTEIVLALLSDKSSAQQWENKMAFSLENAEVDGLAVWMVDWKVACLDC